MKKGYWALAILFHYTSYAQELLTPAEKKNNYTSSYTECIHFYKSLDKKYKQLQLVEAGPSDVDLPIQLVIIDKNGYKDPHQMRKKKRVIIWINNGIHPGEPEGIDASMMWARDLLAKTEYNKILDHVSFIIVPVYNVGGALRRNKHSRANQNGPEEYGFRGNRNNLDLNRDFIKQDSRNSRTFAKQFQNWQPDIFLDTHTTDGADYQYNMTLISGMRSKLPPILGNYLYDVMLPQLYQSMQIENDEMAPYVEYDGVPENGIYAFHDKPRFSSGYAALFHCIPFVLETHMLKPFSVRLESTYRLIKIISQYAMQNSTQILEKKQNSIIATRLEKKYLTQWRHDLSRIKMISFRGYEVDTMHYNLLNENHYSYNRDKPNEIIAPYYEHYAAELRIEIPKYYVIPQCYHEIVENLKRNGVLLKVLEKDTLIQADYYRIQNYKTVNQAYENHYMHYGVTVESSTLGYPYYKGDILISTDQAARRFIVEVLEPETEDSYFNWNFFDGILMRKEYFSDYLFAQRAEQLLREDTDLRKKFDEYVLSKNGKLSMDEKLDFIYKNSSYSEPYINIYPVARIF